MRLMVPLLLAKLWHYWLSWALLVPVALVCIGLALYYVFKVMAAKYPRQ